MTGAIISGEVLFDINNLCQVGVSELALFNGQANWNGGVVRLRGS